MTAPSRQWPKPTILQAVSSWIILIGMLAGIHFTWSYWGSGLDVTYSQQTVARQSGWDTPVTVTPGDRIAQPQPGDPPAWTDTMTDGTVIGWITIPRLGSDWTRAMQEGTGKNVLDNLGVGHYPTTVMPGQEGNSAFAGHRAPADLGYANRIEPGDPIVIRTKTWWFVYKVDRVPWIVDDTAVQVLDPDPNGGRELTLTTCDPMFSVTPASKRLIIHATLDSWMLTADGTPAVLHPNTTGTVTTGTPVARMIHEVHNIAHDTPVTPVLGVCLLVMWLVSDLIALMFSHDRRSRWLTVRDPMQMLWRLQYGVLPVRVVLWVMLMGALTLLSWAWLDPWLAMNVPWLETPHPTV